MKIQPSNIVFAACAAVLGYWFTSMYPLPSLVDQHSKAIQAIQQRMDNEDSTEKDAAKEAARNLEFQKNRETMAKALTTVADTMAASVKEVGLMFTDALNQMKHEQEENRREKERPNAGQTLHPG